MPGQKPETLEAELSKHMERLKTEPVTDEELARAKNQIESSFVFQEDSVHRRASMLARFELIGGYAQKDTFMSKIRAVTAADLTRVANAWFAPDRKTVGVLLPKPR
jgi:zinc protease